MFSFKRRAKNKWERYNRKYNKSKWPIIVDIASVFAVFGLLVLFLALYLYNPSIYNPNLKPEKPNIKEPVYVIDLDNLPLNISTSFETSYLSESNNELLLSFEIDNTAPEPIKNLEIYIKSTDINFNINDLIVVDNNTIEVVSDGFKINYIEPGQKISFKAKSGSSISNIFGKAIDLEIPYNYNLAGQSISQKKTVKSPHIISSIEVRAIVLYTSEGGDKLGVGPIPPVANLPTNYWLFFDVEPLGDVKDFVISANLENYVLPTNNYSVLGGVYNYDEDNKLLTWRVDELAGYNNDTRFAMEIQLIPNDDHVGQVIALLKNINYFAKDSLTGVEIRGNLNPLNTDLSFDRFNQGRGVVRSLDEY